MGNLTKYLPEIILGAVTITAGIILSNWVIARYNEWLAKKPAA